MKTPSVMTAFHSFLVRRLKFCKWTVWQLCQKTQLYPAQDWNPEGPSDLKHNTLTSRLQQLARARSYRVSVLS